MLCAPEKFKNLTYFQIYVIHGFPVNDGNFPRTVSTSSAEVDFVTTVKYLLTSISDTESNCKYADNLPTLTPQTHVNILCIQTTELSFHPQLNQRSEKAETSGAPGLRLSIKRRTPPPIKMHMLTRHMLGSVSGDDMAASDSL